MSPKGLYDDEKPLLMSSEYGPAPFEQKGGAGLSFKLKHSLGVEDHMKTLDIDLNKGL